MRILFFGSTTDSVLVLDTLSTVNRELITLSAVVTQPPRPVGRDKIVTPTPVEIWSKERNITTLSFPSNPEKLWSFSDEQQVIDTLEPIKADLLISASFGVKIPWETIEKATYGGINIHPSLLPRWRGADPVPWAIMSGEHQIGVSVVTLSQDFDKGTILAQKKISILPTDMSDPLRTKLFSIGADLLVEILEKKSYTQAHVRSAVGKKQPYARKFKREDGFEEWETIKKALMEGVEAERIERKWRALHPWPGVWTTLTNLQSNKVTNKRLKIIKLHLDSRKLVLDEVQLEGKRPVSWEQFRRAYVMEFDKSNGN